MKNALISSILVMMCISFIVYLIDYKKAYDKKIKFSIEESFISFPYYTNSYSIDSLGCIHYINEIDSNEVIICGSYTIKNLN